MSDRPVRILLDASAIIAFTWESIDVGEIIAEVDDENAAVGLPMLCLVEASRAVADKDRLTLLVHHRRALCSATIRATGVPWLPCTTSLDAWTPLPPLSRPLTGTSASLRRSQGSTVGSRTADRLSRSDAVRADTGSLPLQVCAA